MAVWFHNVFSLTIIVLIVLTTISWGKAYEDDENEHPLRKKLAALKKKVQDGKERMKDRFNERIQKARDTIKEARARLADREEELKLKIDERKQKKLEKYSEDNGGAQD